MARLRITRGQPGRAAGAPDRPVPWILGLNTKTLLESRTLVKALLKLNSARTQVTTPRKGPVCYSTDESRDLSLSPRILFESCVPTCAMLLAIFFQKARNLARVHHLNQVPSLIPCLDIAPEGGQLCSQELDLDGLFSQFYCPLLDFKLIC